ncbi:hypothetical protein AKJ16_DCAP26764 [Drosera capensis]
MAFMVCWKTYKPNLAAGSELPKSNQFPILNSSPSSPPDLHNPRRLVSTTPRRPPPLCHGLIRSSQVHRHCRLGVEIGVSNANFRDDCIWFGVAVRRLYLVRAFKIRITFDYPCLGFVLTSVSIRLREYMEEYEIQDVNDVPLDVQNHLYLDVVGWRKETVLGLGSEVNSYYVKLRSSSSINTNTTLAAELKQTKCLLIEMRSEMTILKEQSTQ